MNINEIYTYIIEKWIYFYWTIYFYTFPGLFFILWFWLSHVDRVHLRLKSYQTGKFIKDKLGKKINSNKITLIHNYCCYQLNAFSEIIAGITDGILNQNPSLNINIIDNKETQTLLTFRYMEHDNKGTETIPLQISHTEVNTDPILLKLSSIENKEIDKEIDKEVNKEIDKEVDKEIDKLNLGIDIGLNPSSSSSSTPSPKNIPPKKIFRIGKKTHLDTEILQRDIQQDNENLKNKKPGRIYMRR